MLLINTGVSPGSCENRIQRFDIVEIHLIHYKQAVHILPKSYSGAYKVRDNEAPAFTEITTERGC